MSDLIVKPQTELTSCQLHILKNLSDTIEHTCSSVLNSTDLYSRMFSLTGSAGTGKTFLTVQIIKKLMKINHNSSILKNTPCSEPVA